MKIHQFQEVIVTTETAINSYSNGDNRCCSFIEAGDSFALSFNFETLDKLAELMEQLQQIKVDLVESKQRQLRRETLQLSAHTTTQVTLPEFSRVVDF